MEPQRLLRTAVLLCLLAFSAVWWAQSRYLNIVLAQRLMTHQSGWAIVTHFEFQVKDKEQADEGSKASGSPYRPAKEDRPEWMYRF